MSGKSLVAVLLLPLPFAALPLAAILFTGGHARPDIAAGQPDTVTFQFVPQRPVFPLAWNVAGTLEDGCHDASISPIEG